MTPAKYHARVPYNMINIPPSVILLNITNKPTGAKGTNICKSKKNDVHVVGWCSDDDDNVYLDKLQTRGIKNLSSTCET
jgi:hypothetical protein